MKKRIYFTVLYDYYGELFTNQQRLYFEEYYFHNLSLGEIGENYNVSRNAIHKTIKYVEEKLNEYEEKLNLHHKSSLLNEVINKIEDEDLKNQLKALI